MKFKIFSVTSNEGIYVLQWKYYDKLAHTHLSPLDSLTNAAHTHTHKAKVMYYYETLNSIDYKGSMTSLQSCQSGFSSISKHSTSGVSSGMSSSHSEKLPRSLVSNMDHSNGKKWKISNSKMTMQEPYDYYFSDKMMLTIKCLMFKLYLAGFKVVCSNTVLKT